MSQSPMAPGAHPLEYQSGVKMQPQSMTAFAICFWGSLGCFLLAIVLFVAGAVMREKGVLMLGFVAYVPGLVMMVVAIVFMMIKLYRGWAIIQPLRQLDAMERDMPTAGKAVGVPFHPVLQSLLDFCRVPQLVYSD